MEVECGNCAHRWYLEKESVAEYDDGPRCSQCGSRDVEAAELRDIDGAASDFAEAFERFMNGDSPVELVADGVATPDRVRELRREFNDMAGGHQLLSDEELEEIRSEAFEAGSERGRSEAWQLARAMVEQREQQAGEQAYKEGYNDGYNDGQIAGFGLSTDW